jgi:hypothetical protein
MSSFFTGYLLEINQFPRIVGYNGSHETYTVKDIFFFDSNTKEYGYRDSVIPLQSVINKDEIDLNTIRDLINNKEFFLKRTLNFENQTQVWSFDTSKLGELKNVS